MIPSIRNLLVKNDLVHVLWNVDTLDWIAQTPDKIVLRAKRLMRKAPRDSGVILFHDVNSRSVIASKILMDYLSEDSRRTCTLGKIVKDINQGVIEVCSKKSLY
jgi:peptidoglycan/xylan/chitin deacetylase (PgdA/CDA1 family)